MFSLITEENEIKKYHKTFAEQLSNDSVERIPCKLNFPKSNQDSAGRWRTWDGTEYKLDFGPKGETEVLWSSSLNMWMAFRMVKSIHTNKWRYWNSFGLEKPLPHYSVSIAVEINFPIAGKDGHIAGSFVKNEQKRVFIVHSGQLRVGKQNINLYDHKNLSNLKFIECGVLVGELNEPNFSRNVKTFIKEVDKVKENFR